MTENKTVNTWADVQDLESTADIAIPVDPLDRVLGQEEAILIALLLLLSAEHERPMDVIIILLLLLGIK